MDARTSITRDHAFVLTDQDVKKITGLLQERIGKVTIRSESADGLERDYGDAKVLCAIENPWPKRIQVLRFRARSEGGEKQARLWFYEDGYWPIDGEIAAPEAVVERLRRELLDIIDGTRPWYGWLTVGIRKAVPILIFVVCNLVTFVVVILTFGPFPKNPMQPQPGAHQASGWTPILIGMPVGLLLGSLILVIVWVLVRSWRGVFPRGLIAIGQVQKRHETREMVRWVVVIGGLVSIVGSMVATLALLPFTK